MFDLMFRKHPRDIGETYTEHAGHALFIGSRLLLAGCACLTHALVPGLCTRTASNILAEIAELMARRTGEAHAPAAGAVMLETPSS